MCKDEQEKIYVIKKQDMLSIQTPVMNELLTIKFNNMLVQYKIQCKPIIMKLFIPKTPV